MKLLFWSLSLLLLPTIVLAQSIDIPMRLVSLNGEGESIGKVQIHEIADGVEILPALHGLPPGLHGFHIHEKPACGALEKEGRVQAALAAGSHFDPDQSGNHQGPEGRGHRGDLPILNVASDGTAATGSVVSHRLRLSDLHGRSLMIHADPDNYSDQPGGARIACGIIP